VSGGFVWPVRVYYEDTDSGGVVYYANYLKFMERARTEWLRSLGFDQAQLAAEDGVIFAVHSVQLDYRRPARLDDALEVSARPSELRGASIAFEQAVYRKGELLCEGSVRIVCVDPVDMTPRRIPGRVFKVLAEEIR